MLTVFEWARWAFEITINLALLTVVFVEAWLKDATGQRYAVQPTVVLPGWSIDSRDADPQVWVMDPKEQIKSAASALSTEIRSTYVAA